MRYGLFDDGAWEYVATQPDTPLPWINHLGNGDLIGIISNTAGDHAFYRDARLRRITRYRYNNVPLDMGGRYLYLRDGDTGQFWSPAWQPARCDLENYTCRHGLGYTMIGSTFQGIEARVRCFVPLGEDLEVWQLTLINRRQEPAHLFGVMYNIAVERAGPGRDVALSVDGQPIEGSVIPLPEDGRREVRVRAILT